MSDIIHLLPDSVANQIAAGEVIQRPASVIKELVENSIDAGARTINVLVVDAGRTSIQVIDDGKGMSETDARLAFERHATSKITKADDLYALHTMGFRGEALASVAAVAQVELTTRMATEDIGTRLSLSATHVASQEPVACPVGSNFKVENLFFNVPVRRKFLKSNATELNNIVAAFERIALVYPDINFTLHSNGAELLNLKAAPLRQRVVDVFGKRLSQELLPLNVETALCRITGFVGKPETARKKGAHQYFFVNGRYMKHAYFHKAVMGAYERLVPTGEQVSYFIYFEVNAADIDVNIHPVKTEIKFENEHAIWQILSAAVKDAIGKFCEVPAIDFDTVGRPDIPAFNPARDDVQTPQVSYNPQYNPFTPPARGAAFQPTATFQPPARPAVPDGWESLFPAPAGTDDVASVIDEKSPVHYQYKGRYIMTAVKSGLMLIDQQRASLRIRYDHYMEQLRHHTASTQRVLFPEVLQLAPSEAVVMQRVLPDLQAMGFDLADVGGNSFAVNGVPAGLEDVDPLTLVRNIVTDAVEQGRATREALAGILAQSLARHSAIPHGQVLSNDEMEALVNQLFATSNVNYTPDGKPILAILPQHDIDQLLDG